MIRRSESTQLQVDVGEAIRRARVASGKTQVEVAAETEMNQGHLSEIERGLVNITLETLSYLADALGCIASVTLLPKKGRRKSASKK